ncbi:hypothetical protein BH18CHL2_BH18CHL2_02180 [soil metagenome]
MAQPVAGARPRGTSWISVLGGWIASVGMATLLAPIVASIVSSRPGSPNDLSLAVPAIAGVMGAYLVGGYVAGRMAGRSTSWHGMITAFFGLFVVLAVILVGVVADRGYLGDLRLGAGALPAGWPAVVGDAITFGAILGFLGTIFAGWLGGLLAPDRQPVTIRPAAAPSFTPPPKAEAGAAPARPRAGYRLFPALGQKGGDRQDVLVRERAEVRETKSEPR